MHICYGGGAHVVSTGSPAWGLADACEVRQAVDTPIVPLGI